MFIDFEPILQGLEFQLIILNIFHENQVLHANSQVFMLLLYQDLNDNYTLVENLQKLGFKMPGLSKAKNINFIHSFIIPFTWADGTDVCALETSKFDFWSYLSISIWTLHQHTSRISKVSCQSSNCPSWDFISSFIFYSLLSSNEHFNKSHYKFMRLEKKNSRSFDLQSYIRLLGFNSY